jgi:hypothetical protein
MIMDLQTVSALFSQFWLLVNVYKTNARANQLFMWILLCKCHIILYIA